MAYSAVGGNNAYIPTYDGESTGNLMMEYSRNPKSFPLLQYSELRPVNLAKGFYLRIEPEQAARVMFDDGREFAWPPGAERPTGTDNQERFQFASYLTQRRAHSVRTDNRAVEMSAWPVAEVELRAKMQQLMTARTRYAAKILSAASWGANTATATSIGGGLWSAGTVAAPYLEISLQAAAIIINQATLGVVNPEDLVLVFSPDSATAIAQSAEVRALLSNSVYAYPLLTGTLPGAKQRNWSLPPMLYDFRIAIENTVAVTTQRGAATVTRQYAIPRGTAYLLCRKENEMINPTILKVEKGDLKMTDEEMQAVPVNSTLVGFFKEESTVENRVDPWNRLTDLSIATDFDYVVSQVLSGFKFTSCF